MTSTLRALSFRFTVHTDDPVLGRAIDDLFAALRKRGPAEHHYSLTTRRDERAHVDVHRDDEFVARCRDAAAALSWLVWDVNRSAAAASGDHLLLHAGALQVRPNGAAVILPAASGSGKSTLSEWLARAGLPYLTDELVALDLQTGHVLPYPKPITRKPEAEGDRHERHVVIGSGVGTVGESSVPGFVVFPRYVPGARASLSPLSDTEVFLGLAANAVNFAEHGDSATSVLGSLVGRSRCARLITSDAAEAGRLVLGFIGGHPPGAEREIEVDHAA